MKFLEGYYKTINGWYQTIKVTDEKIICEDPSGVDYEIVAEYDDFGRSDLEFVGGGRRRCTRHIHIVMSPSHSFHFQEKHH